VALEAFELVILRRPAAAPDLAPDVLDQNQRGRLAYGEMLRAAGRVVAYGPLVGRQDETCCSIC